MLTRRLLILALGTLAGGIPVHGHHSFAAYYFEDQTVSFEGELAEFEYRNPHAWVHIEARDDLNRMQKVSAEWSNPGRLSRQGITRDTLKPGDRLILTGSPARNPSEYKMHLKRIERPADGWTWAGRGARR
jgi:Family of unknown function (DUF6152)